MPARHCRLAQVRRGGGDRGGDQSVDQNDKLMNFQSDLNYSI